MLRRALIAALLTLAAAPAAAQADVVIDAHTLDASGNPVLDGFASEPNLKDWSVSWHACNPDCGDALAITSTPLTWPTTGAAIGAFPAGTVFEARSNGDPAAVPARTAAWQGTATIATPPTLSGGFRIGDIVAANAGAWTGGWPDDTTTTGIAACPTAAASGGCRVLADPAVYAGKVPRAYVDPSIAGWYLMAYDVRAGKVPPLPMIMPTAAQAADATTTSPGTTTATIAVTVPASSLIANARGVIPTREAPPATRIVAYGAPVGPIAAAHPGSPPSMAGTPAVGTVLTATRGTWPDEPAGGSIYTAIRVCRDRSAAAYCVLLPSRSGKPSDHVAAPDFAHLGWYAGAVDVHLWPQDTKSLEQAQWFMGSARPGFLAVLLGPLAKQPISYATPPTARLFRRAVRVNGHFEFARVRCPSRCVVQVRAWQGDAEPRKPTPLTITKRSTVLKIRASDYPAGRGPIHVAITVDHTTVRTTGRVALP